MIGTVSHTTPMVWLRGSPSERACDSPPVPACPLPYCLRVIPTAKKNGRWHESLFGATEPVLARALGPTRGPANPARDTDPQKRWKSQRFRRLVLQMLLEDDAPVPLIETAVLITLDTFLAILCVVLALH
jgi:hypothetical protein